MTTKRIGITYRALDRLPQELRTAILTCDSPYGDDCSFSTPHTIWLCDEHKIAVAASQGASIAPAGTVFCGGCNGLMPRGQSRCDKCRRRES